MKILTVLLVLRLMMMVCCNDIDRGYPGGFWKYGDKNNDDVIDREDINANLNLGWLKDWYLITKTIPSNKDMIITKDVFMKLLKPQGILQVTIKM